MKILGFILGILLITNSVFADTITVDTSGWTQEQKNMTEAMMVSILHKAGITYDKITVKLPEIIIEKPTAPIGFITTSTIVGAFNIWKQKSLIAQEKARIYEEQRQAELANNELTNITLDLSNETYSLDKIDAKIDAINDLATLKAFFKKLVRYIKAKE